MSNTQRFKVRRIDSDTVQVTEVNPAGCGTYVALIIMIIVMVFALKSCIKEIPNRDGEYKINPNQTAYTLQEGYVYIHAGHDTFAQPEYVHNNTSMSWIENSNSWNIKVNSRFNRMTGSIMLPTCDDLTVQEYWASFPMPPAAYPIDLPLFASDEYIEQQYQGVYDNMIRDFRSISGWRNVFCVSVYGDGRLLYTSPCMLFQNNAVPFEVNIAGVQEIELRYTYLYHVYGKAYGLSSMRISDLQGHTD